MKPEDFISRIKAAAAASGHPDVDSDAPLTPLQIEAHTARLREVYEMFHVEHQFKPGDMVVRKPGLSDSRVGSRGRPVVVLKILPEPVRIPITEKSISLHQTAARYDIVVMDIFEGDAVHFFEDSRRFQPYKG
jgi:hypothetical protein